MEDVDAAEVVLVDDYCYVVSWVGMGHVLGKEAFQQVAETPGDNIIKACPLSC